MKVIRSFVIAFSMYSKIPMPRVEWEKENMIYVLCFFPCIGLVIGAVFYGWFLFCDKMQVGELAKSCIGAAIPLLITGGIHMDGFMDTNDALHSYGSKEKKLEILKDSHIGAFSVISIAGYYLLYIAALSRLEAKQAAVVAAGFTLSRCFSALSLMYLKRAKEEGMLYTLTEAAGRRTTGVSCVLWAELALCIFLSFWLSIPYAAVSLLAAAGSFFYYKRKACREFGGITGDLAGWFLCICELSIASAVALLTCLS